MFKEKPTILIMSEYRKQEILVAVYRTISMANEDIWTTLFLQNSRPQKVLMAGRWHQRYLKRGRRQLEIAQESWRIAKATGAEAGEVESLFLQLMNEYVEPKL